MSKLGDLWVKLGLKSDDYSKGLDQAVDKTSGLKKAFSAIKGVGVAALASIATAAVAAFAKAALETDKFGDKFKRMTSGLKNAWNTFTSSLLNWDWEGFWDRVRGNYKSGAALYDVEDAMYEEGQALRLRRANAEKEANQLRIDLANQNLSLEQQKKAGERWKAIMGPIYKDEEDMANRHRKAVEDNFLKMAQLEANDANRQKLETFLLAGGDVANVGKTWDSTFMAIRKQFAVTSQDGKQKIYDVIAAYGQAAGAFERDSRRIESAINSATAGLGGDTPAAAAGSIAALEEQLKAAQNAVENAVTTEARVAAQMLVNQLQDQLDAKRLTVRMVAEFQSNRLEKLPGITGMAQGGNNGLAGWDEYQRRMKKAAEGTHEATASLEGDLVDLTQVMSDLAKEFSEAVSEGFVDSVQVLTDALFGLEDMDGGKMVAALLSPLADMVTQMGKLIMAAGVAESALFTSLMHPGPEMAGAAIAAGAALVAIGAAAKSGLKALAGGTGNANASTSTYAGGSTGAGANTIQTELTIHIDGKLKGSDIVLSGQRTLNSWSR